MPFVPLFCLPAMTFHNFCEYLKWLFPAMFVVVNEPSSNNASNNAVNCDLSNRPKFIRQSQKHDTLSVDTSFRLLILMLYHWIYWSWLNFNRFVRIDSTNMAHTWHTYEQKTSTLFTWSQRRKIDEKCSLNELPATATACKWLFVIVCDNKNHRLPSRMLCKSANRKTI